MERPRFLPHFRVEALPPDLVFLLHENGHRVLRGRQYFLLAPHLQGGLSSDQIALKVAGQLKPAEVYYCLERLAKQGLLVEHDSASPTSDAAFWSSLEVEPALARDNLSKASVRLLSAGDCAHEKAALRAALDTVGIACLDCEQSLWVVVTDDHLRPELASINTERLAQGRPWLLCKPGGAIGWLGPLFLPDQTGCWECLATRLRRNREVEMFVAKQKGLSALPFTLPRDPAQTDLAERRCLPGLTSTVAQACNLAATEIARYFATGQNLHLQGRVLTLDFGRLEQTSHRLSRHLDCPACGQVAEDELPPIVLRAGSVRASEDAGYRVRPAQEAWESLKDQISPITGVVRQLTRTDQSEGVAPVYLAGHNQAQLSSGYHSLRAGLRSQSSGKGKTDLQARVSGLCEAIERYSGVFRGGERRLRSSFDALGSKAIHPARCLLFSADQYQRRDELNPTLSDMHFIPRPFDEQEQVDWTPLWSLSAGEPRFLPTSFCYYNYHHPESGQCPSIFADSNGNAAGSTLEEAILQGFLELAERDAVALWWYNRLSVPGCDLDSLDDPYIDRLRVYYESLQRRFWVLDVTSDLSIPSYAAVSASTAGGAEEILLGFGAHLDARLAVLRAIEEMNQSLPHLLSWKRGQGGEMDALTAKFWRRATLARQTYLTPSGNSLLPLRASPPPPDLKEAVESCQRTVESRGLELLVLDQTRADIGLPVVKVVVPGLRHFWPRFAPGRLYDIPVEMGRLAEPTAEEDLNRIPMIL